jgi:hypothetical protein
VLIYDWVLTSLEFGFPAVDVRVWYIGALNVIANVVLFVDIYLNFNLSYNINAEKIVDTLRAARRYRDTHFLVDSMLALPYWMLGTFGSIRWALRAPRLLR